MAGRWTRGFTMLATLLGFPALALAQNQCVIPQSLPEGRSVLPAPGQTFVAPVTGHVLALSWSPQFCKTHEGNDYDSQCKSVTKYGFILHGLWPDGEGRKNPQWCKRVPAVSAEVLRQSYCATPSVSLMQHEWAKHGSCIESDAGRYFRAGTLLFNALKFPDMDALSRSQLDVGAFTTAFVAANTGVSADMVRVSVTPLGWLEDVRLCLGKNYRPKACPRDISGAGPRTKLKIWRAN